ncbi:hypothetical protein Leryth_013295 [Lithospermum erythrorhizon]|nr:hypothetical protein Leryth_013295 [Lithospermum erythrorhizon]
MSTLDTEHAETQHPNITTTTTNGAGGSDRIRRHRRRRRRRRPSMAGFSSETATDGSFRFSDTSEDEYHSWRSSMGSITGFGGGGGVGGGGEDGVGVSGSLDECTHHDGVSGFRPGRCRRRGSWGEVKVDLESGSLDECTHHDVVSGFRSGPCRPGRGGSWGDDEVDLESGELEMRKVDSDNKEEEVGKDCRICHLSLMGNGISDDDSNGNAGICIELGCACKGDLGNAHKQCAETWFKMKGNTTCEICGATAINIAGEQAPDLSSATAAVPPVPAASPERHNYCHGRRVMNFLLACMIFAFVISWLFHFNVLS